jgi:hypothetical protein
MIKPLTSKLLSTQNWSDTIQRMQFLQNKPTRRPERNSHPLPIQMPKIQPRKTRNGQEPRTHNQRSQSNSVRHRPHMSTAQIHRTDQTLQSLRRHSTHERTTPRCIKTPNPPPIAPDQTRQPTHKNNTKDKPTESSHRTVITTPRSDQPA